MSIEEKRMYGKVIITKYGGSVIRRKNRSSRMTRRRTRKNDF